jgi:hypothetical protein
MNSKYSIEKSLIINAEPKDIYTILTRLENWNQWTKSITSISLLNAEKIEVGTRIKVIQPKLSPATWTITEIKENSSLVWEKKSFGLKMTAQHSIINDNNNVLVKLSIIYEGLFARLAYKLTSSLTDRYITMEVNGLKAESEKRT